MANQETREKWADKVRAKLTGRSADQIWPLLEDFFNLHKWLPAIDTCVMELKGHQGQPGCIRYCVVSTSSDDSREVIRKWACEKLIAIDPR
ncbi:lachrymatory-factor synthase-like [Melia azedarach]|uniref:Lachrymatory-factor synthase-like n=1 Tax=Melia azedarach TaxID=155640 RepID=A0ACC1XAT9_MELAZ|nr:lachrymatory-factor synthase-like [Melia azedarach]